MEPKKKPMPKLDYGIILSLMLLALVSFITLYSAQTTDQYNINFVLLQAIWYVIGAVAIIFIMQFDSDQMRKISKYAYIIGLVAIIGLILAPVTEYTPLRKGPSYGLSSPVSAKSSLQSL